MGRSFLQGLAVGIFALLFSSSSLGAQEPEAELNLQTQSGQATYHIGERIPLKVTFRSLNDTKYRIDSMRGFGPGCGSESVTVAPSAGWSNPLALYFAQGMVCRFSGPLPQPLLKATPVIRTADLNQWVRFDEPGVYQVKVSSGQVIQGSGASWTPVLLQSNIVELKIVAATPEWQTEKLQSIRDGLKDPSRYPTYSDAKADLRYLATPAAIDEMTSSFRETRYNLAEQCSLGLIGLPPRLRDVAVASMEKRVAEADFPVTTGFIYTLSFLHVNDGSTSAGVREQIQQSDAVLWGTIFSSLRMKNPSARAVTVQTLVSYGRQLSTPEIQSQMGSLLDASLLTLDRSSQITDLGQHWDMLRTQPDILSVLKKIATVPSPVADYNLPGSTDELKSAAFRRWYELDPSEAHAEILDEIGSSTPELSAQALDFLPPEQLGQFETIWAQEFLATRDQLKERLLGSLLVRFGTGAAASVMATKLNELKRNYGCDAHYRALAYLVRFNTEAARPLLEREIATDEAGCGDMLLQRISQEATGPVLNDAAIELLNTNDYGKVRDALDYLTSYGRKLDEAPLWQRYVRWTDAWKATPALVDMTDPNPSVEPQGWVLGMELGRALIANQGWLADQDLISRVLARCIGEQMCRQLHDLASSAARPYRLWIPDVTAPSYRGTSLRFGIAQYTATSFDQLEAKVGQFPAGTTFVLRPFSSDNSDQRKVGDGVQSILKKYGMKTEPWTN